MHPASGMRGSVEGLCRWRTPLEAAMTSTRSRHSSRLLLVLAAAAVTLFGLVAPASAAGPYCGITWGSNTKLVGETSQPGVALTGPRAGPHDCYDRLVVDLNQLSGFGGYTVEYCTP